MVSIDSALSPSASPMLSPLSDEESGPNGRSGTYESHDAAEWQAADNQILFLLRQHANVHQKMAQYDCQEVVKEIESFSPEMQKTAWALTLVGRAYYEMVDYTRVSTHVYPAAPI